MRKGQAIVLFGQLLPLIKKRASEAKAPEAAQKPVCKLFDSLILKACKIVSEGSFKAKPP